MTRLARVTRSPAIALPRLEVPEAGLRIRLQDAIEELVRRAQANDREAFGELYKIYGPKIFSYLVYHLDGQVEVAEDLTEEVFVKVLQALHTFRFSGLPFTSWLYRVAHNHMVDYLRALPRRATQSIDDYLEIPDHRARDFEEAVVTTDQLKTALAAITPEQRQVVVLRLIQGLSIAETAQAVGRSQEAVKQLQSRGLRALHRVMTRRNMTA